MAYNRNVALYFVRFKHGNLLFFGKQHIPHPTVNMVQSRRTKGKWREGGGACYLGNNSESPWGKRCVH